MVSAGLADVAAALLEGAPVSPDAMPADTGKGIYAWWGTERIPWPTGFPSVDTALPLYVGIAETETLSSRIRNHHLAKTRSSALRRSLVALLSDTAGLDAHVVVRDASSPSKFGMNATGESILTEWMLENLRLTWVECDDPHPVETTLIRRLLPPLNDKDAKGSPYRPIMRRLRESVAARALQGGRLGREGAAVNAEKDSERSGGTEAQASRPRSGLVPLDQAMERQQIPLGNRPLVREALARIGVSGCDPTVESYIKVERLDGKHPLHVHSGYTDYFESREEAERAVNGAAGVSSWATKDGKRRWWYIEHPDNSLHDTPAAPKRTQVRDYGTCPVCYTTRTASGACLCD